MTAMTSKSKDTVATGNKRPRRSYHHMANLECCFDIVRDYRGQASASQLLRLSYKSVCQLVSAEFASTEAERQNVGALAMKGISHGEHGEHGEHGGNQVVTRLVRE